MYFLCLYKEGNADEILVWQVCHHNASSLLFIHYHTIFIIPLKSSLKTPKPLVLSFSAYYNAVQQPVLIYPNLQKCEFTGLANFLNQRVLRQDNGALRKTKPKIKLIVMDLVISSQFRVFDFHPVPLLKCIKSVNSCLKGKEQNSNNVVRFGKCLEVVESIHKCKNWLKHTSTRVVPLSVFIFLECICPSEKQGTTYSWQSKEDLK